jgi:cell division septation protein DedD
MQNELKKLGHNAFIKTVNLKDSGTWHRVYIERYNTRAEAVREARVFKKLELIFEFGIDPINEKEIAEDKKPVPKQRVFFLHIYSFAEKENAEKNVKILGDEGQKAFYVKENIKGRDWYRVYIGEFISEQSARQTGAALMKKGVIPYFKPIEIDRGILNQGTEESSQSRTPKSGN